MTPIRADLDCNATQNRMSAIQKLKGEFDIVYRDAQTVKNTENIVRAKALKKRLEQELQSLRDILPVAHMESAQEILGKNNVFGPEAILDTFGFYPESTPPIPFSEKELELAKREGWSLILRVAKDEKGRTMNFDHIATLAEAHIKEELFPGTIKNSWSWSGIRYAEGTVRQEWVLVANSFVSDMHAKKDEQGNHVRDITDYNYIHQTRVLRDCVKRLGLLPTKEELSCANKTLQALSRAIGVNWNTQGIEDRNKHIEVRNANFKLASFYVNKHFRRLPIEALYDGVILYKMKGSWGHLKNKNEASSIVTDKNILLFGSGGFISSQSVDHHGHTGVTFACGVSAFENMNLRKKK